MRDDARGSPAEELVYHWAVLNVVPHPRVGSARPVGVVVHARTAGYLGTRVRSDESFLRSLCDTVDPVLLGRYLDAWTRIAAGDPEAGPVALAPPSERFHWLTAPRSDVLQCSPVHEGVGRDPAAALDELFDSTVGAGG